MFSAMRTKLKNFNMIRRAIDSYPGGLCFSTVGGRPILSNNKMNSLIYTLTGHTIVEVNETWYELKDQRINSDCKLLNNREETAGLVELSNDSLAFSMPDKSVWHFQKKIVINAKIKTLQFTATDITELYKTSVELYNTNQKLKSIQDRQTRLLQNIVNINEGKEILAAKMYIHDELGQCLILTNNALNTDEISDEDFKKLSNKWLTTLNDLKNVTTKKEISSSNTEIELLKVAKMLGCEIKFAGERPTEKSAALLMYATVREALTNATRHGHANELYVNIDTRKNDYLISITNNGNKNVTEIREGVGLGSLRKRVEQEGAKLSFDCSDGVKTILQISRNGE